MRWLKRKMWKAGIAITGMLLLLVLMISVPVSTVEADEGTSGLVTPGTVRVQATPTEDATVTALGKKKLLQDVDQQQHTLGNWFWNNGAALVSSLVLAIAGAFTLFRYLRDQRNAREKQREDRQTELEKRAEERFQAVVEGLGSEREEAKVGAAITLRTFLRPGYEQFYTQVFDLAVAHLRPSSTSHPSEDPHTPLPLSWSACTCVRAVCERLISAMPNSARLTSNGPTLTEPTSAGSTSGGPNSWGLISAGPRCGRRTSVELTATRLTSAGPTST